LTRNAVLRPQRMLAQATRDAERMRQPAGLGLDSPTVRARMVARLTSLASDRVLRAMAEVPRHRFVDPALAPQAYEDTALPIGFGQTISKPSVVARMLQLAQSRGQLGRVLEIGTGCGYQAAVLSELGQSLVSVERIAGLHEQARQRLQAWRRERHPGRSLQVLHDDGSRAGLLSGPFDSIVSAAGGEHLPQAWVDLLAPGGRLVAPVGEDGAQALWVVDHEVVNGRSQHRRQRLEAVAFVPLKSGLA
jgi:protein-L-isoaspartate(D-aspartate) O-methyltransferase